MPTDATTFLNDLDAGVFANKVGQGITDAARGAINHDKKGRSLSRSTSSGSVTAARSW